MYVYCFCGEVVDDMVVWCEDGERRKQEFITRRVKREIPSR
jgi:hypothetical protein